jgi:hypothetical protein
VLGVAGIVLAVLLTLEFALRLTSAAVAKHSVVTGALTVVLITAARVAWLRLFNRKAAWKRR